MSKGVLFRISLWILCLACCANAEITYSHDVAAIFYQKCTACHHPNDIAPMSLMDYKSARPWARAIRQAVLLKRMPPWFADPGTGHFSNDPSLSESESQTITRWVDEGAKEGNPSELPQLLSTWMVGVLANPTRCSTLGRIMC